MLAHPHPLHGGTLHSPVIFHTDRELHDLAAVASWLRGIAPSVPLLLVGYSFGSLCSIRHALSDTRIAGVVAIGLPVNQLRDRGDRRAEPTAGAGARQSRRAG